VAAPAPPTPWKVAPGASPVAVPISCGVRRAGMRVEWTVNTILPRPVLYGNHRFGIGGRQRLLDTSRRVHCIIVQGWSRSSMDQETSPPQYSFTREASSRMAASTAAPSMSFAPSMVKSALRHQRATPLPGVKPHFARFRDSQDSYRAANARITDSRRLDQVSGSSIAQSVDPFDGVYPES